APDGETAALGTVRSLISLRENAGGAFLISDFAWRRSRVLRELTARAFDQAETRPLLAAVRAVTLDGGSHADGILFSSWLAARLGWAFADAAASIGEYRDGSGKEVRFVHATPGFPLSDGFRLRFSFDSKDDVTIGCTRGGCVSDGAERGAYKFPSDGEILLEEVDSLTQDPVYQETLDHAGRLRG
ncbi:MAG TPA: OpcA/G6PD domain-containing protein, partial [Spirochaetia bacterium]|nr:OpcA/G6PD domain-containing protein [Spirochaetia bacterium]